MLTPIRMELKQAVSFSGSRELKDAGHEDRFCGRIFTGSDRVRGHLSFHNGACVACTILEYS
jgi:hypothetical protein